MSPIKTEVNTISTSSNDGTIPLGEYLFLRILQANPKLKSIFGIPGDFQLALLEHLYCESIVSKDVKFVGLCNELNGAYTADGYARLIGGLSVLITTYGVGELSAINGIAGAFAEYSPVLHIVGTTSTKQQQVDDSQQVINHHHLIQNKNPLKQPNHDVYKHMVDSVSVIQESLDHDMAANVEKIDKVLTTIIKDLRPGYLFIPSDVSDFRVEAKYLNHPLNLIENFRNTPMANQKLSMLTEMILSKLYKAKNPSVLIDTLITRFNHQDVLDEFVKNLPSNLVKLFTTNMGRNVNESLPNFVGCYYGVGTTDRRIVDEIENNSDLLINLGYFNGETNNAGYSTDFSKIDDYVEIHPDYVLIDKRYHYTKSDEGRLFSIGDLVANINKQFQGDKFVHKSANNIKYRFEPTQLYTPSKTDAVYIPQKKIIDWMNSYLQPNDVLIVETCSFQFALPDLKLPPGVKVVSQNFYGSIGFAIPACLGATFAVNDLKSNRRILLMQGDGSAQMTIQDISTFIKYHDYLPIKPKIFVINNDGYTVERIIKGPTRSYNDILGTWNWSKLLQTMGDENCKYHKGIKLNNVQEFDDYFANEQEDDRLQVFDLITGKFDVPERFSSLFISK
jgi:phenylpyruvate decarboxylase